MKQGLGALLRPSSPRQKAKKKKTSGRRCAVIIIMKKKKKEKKIRKKRKEIKYQIVEKEGKRTMRTTIAHSNLETLEWVADKLFISSQVRETP
jgi:hypothetical protein